jgi:hypothetical protein
MSDNGKEIKIEVVEAKIQRMVLEFNETNGAFHIEGVPPSLVTAFGMLQMASAVLVGGMNKPSVGMRSPILMPNMRL